VFLAGAAAYVRFVRNDKPNIASARHPATTCGDATGGERRRAAALRADLGNTRHVRARTPAGAARLRAACRISAPIQRAEES
jgi:hypothetical protein